LTIAGFNREVNWLIIIAYKNEVNMCLNKIGYFIMVLGLILFLGSCARNKKFQNKAEDQYKLGNYEVATFYAIESLKLKPDYQKAQQTLKQCYPLAITQRSQKILKLKERKDDDRWEDLLVEYMALQKLNDALGSLAPLSDPETGQGIRFDLRDYSVEIAEAKSHVAENYYRKGIHQSRIDDSKAGQRIAAEYFKKAMAFVPNYLDSASRYEIARQNAVTRIAIMPFEDKSGSHNRYGAIADILMDQILDQLMQNATDMEYTELITRDRIEALLEEQELGASGLVDENSAAAIGHLLGAHTILSGKILQINHVPAKLIQHDITESVQVEPVDDVADKDRTISCTISKYVSSTSMQVLASYTMLDVSTGKILSHKSFDPLYEYTYEWGKYVEGDKNALSEEQKSLLEMAEENPPTARQMLNRVLADLGDEIADHLLRQIQ
jgi:hypothetical protein